MERKVLFVCLGNICRSPTAEGVFRRYVDNANLQERIRIESAGTGSWHIGEPPDKRAQSAARRRGYDLASIRARQVMPEDFEHFDYVLAMDRSNHDDLLALADPGHHHKIELFLTYGQRFNEEEVPDPYYGGANGFDHVLDLIEDAGEHLLSAIAKELK